MKKVDLNHWPRNERYQFFKQLNHPRFSITAELDITSFYQYVKQESLSFYLSMIHLLMEEINKLEAIKYRIKGNEVYLFEILHPSFTDSIDNTDDFKIVNAPFYSDMHQFIESAKQKSIKQGHTFVNHEDESRQDFIYISTFPWASCTQITHAYHDANQDAVPRVTWSKYYQKNGSYMMPITIEVHHAFVDGRHVGMLLNHLQERMNQF